MLTVIDQSTSEPLINYKAFEEYEEINGSLTLTFTSIESENNPGHKLLKGEALIETEEGRQFRVKQMGGSTYRKQISATSIYFDLKGTQKYDIYGGTKTLNEFLAWILEGSGWTFENVDVTGSRLIENFGKADALKLIEILLSEFECERRILPGKRLRFEKKIGPDNDAQYRYGHNIKAININEDTTNYGTVIRGYGADGMTVTYRSPKADIVGEIHAEPFTDERFTIPESLLERLKKELRDEPEVAYELDAYELTEKELGERVWLIHEILEIEFSTRVLAKTNRIPKEKSTVVIGTTKPATVTDQLAEQDVKIDENQKQNQSKFEQTNEKFTLEVSRLDGAIVEANAAITITADEIRSEVSAINSSLKGEIASANSVISQLAGQMTLKADSTTVNNQIRNVELSLNGLSGEISSIVSFTDVDGSEIISKVNQSASAFKVDAKNIELDGITRVAESLAVGYGYAGNKDIYFYNGGALTSFSDATSMEMSAPGDLYLSANEVRFDAYGAPSNKSKINFSTAESINWGTHAPDTTARFG